MYRTHNCNSLAKEDIGKTATLTGWVDSRRDHGGVVFIDLRDREGITQVVFRPEEHAESAAAAHHLRNEDVIQVTGKVAARLDGTENPKLTTGAVEVIPHELIVLNKAAVLPFPLDEEVGNEDLRLTHRYLDLRRKSLVANIKLRHRLVKAARDFLDAEGYLEVETPILSKSTPEGARDFLVPSRLTPGAFYALPQAPQQYKQILMVAGLERYFQIARCFRDEDLRADRQPEFTQIDVEASFVAQDDIISLIERLFQVLYREAHGIEIETSFLRLTYEEAMNRFGTDRPDMRFALELTDLSETFRQSQFKVFRGALDGGGVVKAINAKGLAKITTGQIEDLTELAKQYGARGLAYIKVEGGEWKSPIVKFFSEAERAALNEALDVEEGDLILFGADKWDIVCEVLGRIRLHAADLLELTKGSRDLRFLWVVDFPLLMFGAEEGKWNPVHHPFTRPKAEDLEQFENGNFEKVRAEAYDIVLNGVELGGGSLRIHEPPLQAKMFEILGITEEQQKEQFGHLLKALTFGAPPHGGIALGLDRIIMMLCEAESIRDVIAFPKNNRGLDLMTHSPAEVDFKQLRELYIEVKRKT